MTELPDEFWQGVEQFNQREFYACHDTLEALWIEATEPDKKFYQGILQIAVALYHLGNQNWRGAVILLGEGMNRLRGYQPAYAGVDVEHFLGQTLPLFTALQETGSDQVATVIQQLGESPFHPDTGALLDSVKTQANSDQPTIASSHPLTFPTLRKCAA